MATTEPLAEPRVEASRGLTALRRPLTVTERSWLRAAGILVGSVAIFVAAYAIELDLGRWNRAIRFVSDPSETTMRYLGISHFLVAFLFMSTSKKMRGLRPWAIFAGLLAAGIVICRGYGRLLAFSPLLAGIVFFGYFLVHDFRDQVFFYFANGDAPETRDPQALAKILFRAPFLIVGALASGPIAVLAFDPNLFRPIVPDLTDPVAAMPDVVRWAIGVLPATVVVAASLSLRREWRRQNLGPVGGFLRVHRPVLTVLGGTFLVLAAGLSAGRAHPIVILHVAAWYVFSVRMLKKQPAPAPPPRRSTWQWLRSTPAGFRLLHVGSFALLVAAGVVWAYGFRNDASFGPLRMLLGKDSFPYWTILHVTVSLAPK